MEYQVRNARGKALAGPFLNPFMSVDPAARLSKLVPLLSPHFWETWYQKATGGFSELRALLLRLDNETFSLDFISELYKALAYWIRLERKFESGGAQKRLVDFLGEWERFRGKYLKRYRNGEVLWKVLAVPFAARILKVIEEEESRLGAESSLWGKIQLLKAVFRKVAGNYDSAEIVLKDLLQREIQKNEVFFELSDLYALQGKKELIYYAARSALQGEPIHETIAFTFSSFWDELISQLPKSLQNGNKEGLYYWAGVYALGRGELGPGYLISQRRQKDYWEIILQLKKLLEQEASSIPNTEGGAAGSVWGSNPHCEIIKAQLLIYYILLLEHLALFRTQEISAEILEENSLIWQNIELEIFCLSADVYQLCQKRFPANYFT